MGRIVEASISPPEIMGPSIGVAEATLAAAIMVFPIKLATRGEVVREETVLLGCALDACGVGCLAMGDHPSRLSYACCIWVLRISSHAVMASAVVSQVTWTLMSGTWSSRWQNCLTLISFPFLPPMNASPFNSGWAQSLAAVMPLMELSSGDLAADWVDNVHPVGC